VVLPLRGDALGTNCAAASINEAGFDSALMEIPLAHADRNGLACELRPCGSAPPVEGDAAGVRAAGDRV